MEWYLKVLRNYFNFEGRARRKEYWMFVLFNLIAGVVLAIVDSVLHTRTASGIGIVGSLYSLAVLVPSIAVGARRLHDIGRSGWWQLVGLIPVLGWIVMIVWAATEGDSGSNRFGPDPKLGEGGAPAMA
jgi:uncharacterized membrane protein YhaH (DUF805 family)